MCYEVTYIVNVLRRCNIFSPPAHGDVPQVAQWAGAVAVRTKYSRTTQTQRPGYSRRLHREGQVGDIGHSAQLITSEATLRPVPNCAYPVATYRIYNTHNAPTVLPSVHDALEGALQLLAQLQHHVQHGAAGVAHVAAQRRQLLLQLGLICTT